MFKTDSGTEFDIIDQKFISESFSFSNKRDGDADLVIDRRSKVFQDHTVLMQSCSDDDDEKTRSPLKGSIQINLCGTHM